MSSPASGVADLVKALRNLASPEVPPLPDGVLEGAFFTGCGDSLSAALLAVNYGCPAVSAGDLAWYDGRLRQAKGLVALSYSGATAATVQAALKAKASGLTTFAVTPDAASPLAVACSHHIAVPRPALAETVPAAGYVALSLGTLAAFGADVSGGPEVIAKVLEELAARATQALEELSPAPCQGVSVLSLPDLRSSGDFWALKFIEATGLATRAVALEECGHVDYFIGPQPHLTVQLIGPQGRERHAALGAALETNGHTVLGIDVASHLRADRRQHQQPDLMDELTAIAVGALGASVASAVASRWHRAPFRGGEVDMSASHIQVPSVAPVGAPRRNDVSAQP